MRKNPYNKDLKDQFPLFMPGPSTITVLIENEAQKVVLEKGKTLPPVNIYQVRGKSFAMVKPPFLNQNGTFYPQEIANIEMGQTEVTQELFKAVMGWNDSDFKNNPQHPVESVTWYDCISFCNNLSELLGLRLCYKMTRVKKSDEYPNSIESAEVVWNETANGFRLPTEYEWESFAKADTQNKWSGTNDVSELSKYAWYTGNSRYRTYPVGKKLPNEWGLHDMSGNVWEWCWDMFGHYSSIARPTRGGSSWDAPEEFKSADTFLCDVNDRYYARGFRICRENQMKDS